MTARRVAWTGFERSELVALAAILSLGAVILGRHLGSVSLEFDEGVYVSSASLLERGLVLGRDVFSSQPPLFLTALAGVARFAGDSLAVVHGASIGVALIGGSGRLGDRSRHLRSVPGARRPGDGDACARRRRCGGRCQR